MTCPYKDRPSLHTLPCTWTAHPDNEYIRLCDVCQHYYDVRDVGNPFPGWMLFTVLSIILSIYGNAVLYDQPPSKAPAAPTADQVNSPQ